MKYALVLLLLAFNASAADFGDALREEFKEATYGLHLFSDHAENRGTNNGNLGVYIRTKSGWSLGHYHNSCNTYTNYYGWSAPEWYRITLTPAIASGYHCLTEKIGVEEGKRWSFTIVPTVRLVSFDNVYGIRRVSLRGVIVPGLTHLMLEAKF